MVRLLIGERERADQQGKLLSYCNEVGTILVTSHKYSVIVLIIQTSRTNQQFNSKFLLVFKLNLHFSFCQLVLNLTLC